ncbi:MAG: Uma2 family endonuclease [Aphanocapsa lilacina HA4352-LM1]|jgi:Uma2 family endonuclease|nr:Uma2 family endonuclease [Aphanocapsa lilacina HA4352-LM1]
MQVGEQRVVLHNIPWSLYEQLLEALGEHRGVRLAYSKGTLEIMSPPPVHESVNRLLGRLVEAWGDWTGVEVQDLGSMTMNREDLGKGIEPDSCFYIANLGAVAGRDRLDFTQDPPPELAIEVDITSTSLTRRRIYQTLGVPELWCWAGERLAVFHLVDGQYQPAQASRVLPGFPVQYLTELVLLGTRTTHPRAVQRLREILQQA